MSTQLLPPQAIAAIFALTCEEHISADPQVLHRAFREARGLTPLLDSFSFPGCEHHPFSPELTDALDDLITDRLIRVDEVRERYQVLVKLRDYVERWLSRLEPEELERLRTVAAIIREKCCTPCVQA